MKIPTYASIPGLSRYPENDRFAVYRATHKRLLRDDVAYRSHRNSHVGGIVAASIASAGAYVGGGPYGIALSLVLPACTAFVVVFLAFRQQKFMNDRIGEALQK